MSLNFSQLKRLNIKTKTSTSNRVPADYDSPMDADAPTDASMDTEATMWCRDDLIVPPKLHSIIEEPCITETQKNNLVSWLMPKGQITNKMTQQPGICDRAPFLPECQQANRSSCKTGSFTGTLSNGELILGEIYETKIARLKNRYRRTIKTKGLEIDIKGDGYQDSWAELIEGEQLNLDVIQQGLMVTVTLGDVSCRYG